jgi:hypothetical protein
VAYPAKIIAGFAVTRDDIEAQRSPVQLGVALQQSPGRSHDALAFAGIDARRGATPFVSLSSAHFHNQYGACMQRHQIELAATGAKVSQQNGCAM